MNIASMIINVNDLKTGTEVILRNGFSAIIKDSKKGQTRMALVYGICEELGSIYATDIRTAKIDGKYIVVEYPDSYIKAMNMRKSFGF